MMSLSIIIPVYNVEKYLSKCLDSILVGNSFAGQVLCVNDGSTDGSSAILDQYAKKYPNVEILSQSNAGLSAARNAGVKAAKGEYICFVDSDDYWEPNVLGGLMEQIERDKLDVLRYRFQYVNSQYQVFSPFSVNPFRGNDYSEKPTDGVSFLNTRMNTQCYAWTFVVKRSLLVTSERVNELTNECLFTEGIHFEDVDWTPRMLLKARRVASAPIVVYNYLIREGSITQDADNIEKKRRNVEDTLDVITRLNKLIEDFSGCIWLTKMRSDLSIAVLDSIAKYLYPQRDEYIRQLCNLDVFPLIAPYYERSIKCKVQLYNISPRLMISLMHLYRGGFMQK